MDGGTKELIVARVCAGIVRLHVHLPGKARPTTLLLKRPTREQVYIAQEIYLEQMREAELQGAFTEEALLEWMYEEGNWDASKQKLLTTLPKDIEEWKIKLFRATFRSEEKKTIRLYLDAARSALYRTLEERHKWDHLSCAGVAGMARSRYLMGCSLYWTNGAPVFNHDEFWEESCELLDHAMKAWSKERIGEDAFREIARTDPWRSIWSTRKSEPSLFGVPSVDYTEEQRGLIGWSLLYDSVYEHPERPADDIIEDNDALDGWLIEQRREQEKRVNKVSAEDLIGNEKIRNSSEVFLVAETIKDAEKVDNLNDPHAKSIKKRRFEHLKKKGTVSESDMPDTKQNLRAQTHSQFMDTVQSGKKG